MADTKRPKAPTFTTPSGIFKFPKLNEPDTKFNANGDYSTKFISDLATMGDLIAKLEPIHAKAISEGKEAFAKMDVATRKKLEKKGVTFTANPFFNPMYDDKEEETDGVEFNFKMSASGVYKTGPKTGQTWTRKPTIFDAKGKPMTKPPQIWGGTTGKVNFEVSPYWVPGQLAAGISLRLQAVQIIDLVSGGTRAAKDYGFGEEEGYEDTPADETTGFGDETSSAPNSASNGDTPDF